MINYLCIIEYGILNEVLERWETNLILECKTIYHVTEGIIVHN